MLLVVKGREKKRERKKRAAIPDERIECTVRWRCGQHGGRVGNGREHSGTEGGGRIYKRSNEGAGRGAREERVAG